MILTCPSCGTRYQSDSARFVAPGRNVRCAKCAHVWFQSAPEPEREPEPQPEPEIVAEREPVAEPEYKPEAPLVPVPQFAAPNAAPMSEALPMRRRVRRRAGGLAVQVISWAALVFLAVFVGWATVQFRQPIVDMWPQTASLYNAVGLPVIVRGITLSNIAYQQQVEDGQPVLSVTGKVINASDRELPVPIIRVVLTDDSKHEVYHWTFDVGVSTLKPGAESSFVTRLSSPPPEARNLNIRFAEAGETQ
jgi:predicted Zn finger-like uncharacterized protein